MRYVLLMMMPGCRLGLCHSSSSSVCIIHLVHTLSSIFSLSLMLWWIELYRERQGNKWFEQSFIDDEWALIYNGNSFLRGTRWSVEMPFQEPPWRLLEVCDRTSRKELGLFPNNHKNYLVVTLPVITAWLHSGPSSDKVSSKNPVGKIWGVV